MTAQVLLKLSDRAYRRAKSLAEMNNQEISEAIAEYLEAHLPATLVENTDEQSRASQFAETRHATIDAKSRDQVRQRQYQELDEEMDAYIQLHPQLKLSHMGIYIALYKGKLIDEDPDFGTLVERVRSKLPTQIVLMTQVEDEPMPTIVLRSPRLLPDGA